jgi:ubiquinone/menaquinone biosynthesis C-methylase UbiE
MNVEQAVAQRYSKAAGARADELCCPVDYDDRYLQIIPREILERDYGCGDPTRHLRAGETVLDLGSGGGKACYIASQVVGAEGRVHGIDMNDEMLALAESHRSAIGDGLGYHNVTFHKGKIQDLALDLGKREAYLVEHPVRTASELDALERWKQAERLERPMIADESIDVIVSNCVLNLVRPGDKRRLFREMHRVLRPGGRVVISDIVCDEDVPAILQQDPELWSGCISGAFREDLFLQAFEQTGFHGIRLLRRDAEPWQVVRGIEFRSITVEASKGEAGPCLERNQAVIYKGPWRSVTDDDGLRIYTTTPYSADIDPVPPLDEVPLDQAPTFDGSTDRLRDPRETKGRDYDLTKRTDAPRCGADSDCC